MKSTAFVVLVSFVSILFGQVIIPPSNISITHLPGNSYLSFDAVSGATMYRVEESETPDGPWYTIGFSTTNQYQLSNFSYAVKKFYRVRSIFESNESGLVVSSNAVLFGPAAQNAVIQIETDHIVIDTSRLDTSQYTAGKVLVSAPFSQAPQGFLRKITSVVTFTHYFIINTQQARLTELFDNANIIMSHQLSSDEIVSTEYLSRDVVYNADPTDRFSMTYNLNKEVNLGNGITFTIGGQVVNTLSFDGIVDISLLHGLESAEFKCYAHGTGNLSISCDESYEYSESIPMVRHRFSPVVFWVGGFPISFTPVVTVNIYLDINGEVGVSASVSQDLSFETGIRYENDEWTTFSFDHNDFEVSGPDIDGTAEIQVGAGPEAAFYLYEVAGPYANLKASIQFIANVNNIPWWVLKGLVDAQVGFRVDALGYVTDSSILNVNVYCDTLATSSKVIKPEIEPDSAVYYENQTITICSNTPNAILTYTLDGMEPTINSTVYSQPFELDYSATIKAKGYKIGYDPSDTSSEVIELKCLQVDYSVAGGEYEDPVLVGLSCSTIGSEIHYTLDETEPTVSSPLYGAPIQINTATILKAKSFKVGWSSSNTTSQSYTFTIDLEEGLVAYYPFNGNTNDASGFGHDGINEDVAFTYDRFGSYNDCASFNGTNSRVIVPSQFLFHQNSNASMSFWIKRNDSQVRTVFWTRNDDIDANRFHIFTAFDGQGLTVDYRPPDGSLHLDNQSGHQLELPAGMWYHIVLVRNGNQYELYKDGVLTFSVTDSYPSLPTYDGFWRIGKGWFGNLGFYGNLDDIRVYNRVLSYDEIQNLYHESGWPDLALGQGLEAYFPFNGNANDESGNEHHGTNHGCLAVADRFGNTNSSYHFNGIDSYVDMGSWSYGGSITMALWVNSELTRDNFQRFIDLSNGFNSQTYSDNVILGTTDVPYETFFALNPPYQIRAYNTMEYNSWVFVVAVVEDNGMMKLYKNGELIGQTQAVLPQLLSRQNQFIGRCLLTIDRYYQGCLDDVRFYNRALSQAEILALYHEGGWPEMPLSQGLIAYYPFNGNADDESGNGHNATTYNVTYDADRFQCSQNALSFDGNNDYMIVPNTFIYHEPGNKTINIWVKLANLDGHAIFWTRNDFNDTNRYNINWNGYGISLDYRSPEGVVHIESNPVAMPTITSNTWHMITINRISNVYVFYLDGQYLDSRVDSNPAIPDYVGPWIVGKDWRTSQYELDFNGSLDDIRFYNRALSETEILVLYHDRGWPLEMVEVQGGTFQMGGVGIAEPVHQVTLDSFFIGIHEVTQSEWSSVMGSNPSHFTGNPLYPVEQVTWYECIEFCNALSSQQGLTPCYSIDGQTVACDFNASGYRLPTEAEWEFAARGGINSLGYLYSGSNNPDEVAWSYNNSNFHPHDIKTLNPNETSLFDMSGNVWELCWDWDAPYSSSSQNNPTGPLSGSLKARRGGGWYDVISAYPVFYRYPINPSASDYNTGFRICRKVD